jgi:hypothetical protein
MTVLEVKASESSAMDKLEAALDLETKPGLVQGVARNAVASLAGAADFAVLAWDRRDPEDSVPSWAVACGLRWPVHAWLRAEAGKRNSPYIRVVDIPKAISESHTPGSRFVILQDEAATRLHNAGMPSGKARRILGAFVEMADNATEHSLSPIQPFATFEISDGWWEFSVNDLGRGVPDSLRTNPRYANLNDHAAVRAALQDGVSRFDDDTRGTGYGVMLRALAEHECVIRLRTGRIAVRWQGQGIGLTNLIYALVGSRVGLHLRVAGEF